jgi:hypothetical protein
MGSRDGGVLLQDICRKTCRLECCKRKLRSPAGGCMLDRGILLQIDPKANDLLYDSFCVC